MPIKEATFQKGLKVVEAGLQGSFQQKFLDFLWKVVKDTSDEAWMECCTRLALVTRKTNDLVAGDFAETLREIGQEKARQGAVWKFRAELKEPDWQGMARKVCADPGASQASKDIARRLASRKEEGPAPALQGGEKYRRQD